MTLTGPGKPRSLTLSTARAEPTLTRLRDGRVVVSGGYKIDVDFSWEDTYVGLAAVEVVDPVRMTVKRVDGLKLARYHHSVLEVAPGRLLVVGGSSQDGAAIASVEILLV